MTEHNTITAEIREDVGKGASRRLRHAGKVPAIIYGGQKDPVSLTLEHDPVMHAADQDSFYSSILEIKVGDGRTQKVVVRDLQRHPFRQQIMHIDFLRVSATEKLKIAVPLHFVGEEDSPAGKESGVVIQHQMTELEITALPENLPESLEVDLSELDAGGAVHLDEITLPEGVEVTALATDEEYNPILASAVHIRESQGEGVLAAEADAEFAEGEEGEITEAAAEGEAAESEEAGAAEGEADGESEGDSEEEES